MAEQVTLLATENGLTVAGGSRLARRGLSGARSTLLPILLALAVFVLWQVVVDWANIPEVILPSPIAILQATIDQHEILLRHAVPTTLESAAGFILATVFGVSLSVALCYSTILREALYPNLVVFQLIPKIALAPLFIIWLGIGSPSRLAFAIFISFFPIVIATTAGLTNVDRDMVRLCRALTASEWQIFTSVRLPSALPYVFSGMKIGVTLSIIGVIIGEFITAQAGLGYLITFATARADTTIALAAIFVLCICGLLLFGIVAVLERAAQRIWGAA
jgi:NitT/TauT family transport system permease protein